MLANDAFNLPCSGRRRVIRIMIVDDHQIVLTGIQSMLEGREDLLVVAAVNNGEEALKQARELDLDVILLDINMPGMGGIETMKRLDAKHPEINVLGLSMYSKGPYPARFLQAGGAGYITKDASLDEMIHAIKQVHVGGHYISQHVATNIVVTNLETEPYGLLSKLTTRELQVLRQISIGAAITDIADELFMSEKTVRGYRSKLLKKLHLDNDVQLSEFAQQHGLRE